MPPRAVQVGIAPMVPMDSGLVQNVEICSVTLGDDGKQKKNKLEEEIVKLLWAKFLS
jgi:hypothetical protein